MDADDIYTLQDRICAIFDATADNVAKEHFIVTYNL